MDNHDPNDLHCGHGIGWEFAHHCGQCQTEERVKRNGKTMKQQTHYITLEVVHHGNAKQIAELISQAAYCLSQVDDARLLAYGAAVVRPEAAV